MTDETVILVCTRLKGNLLFPDNLVGRCRECRHRVEFRPHAPANRILRCMQCALALMTPEDVVVTTPAMLDDAARYIVRKTLKRLN